MKIYILLLAILICNSTFAQQPDYTPKTLLTDGDTIQLSDKFNLTGDQSTKFFSIRTEVMDVDDNQTTHVKTETNLLVCLVGNFSIRQKHGKYETYAFLIPGEKPVKIWEQNFKKGKLNGAWNTFNLQGTLVSFETYENDSLQGISRYYQIDGKTVSTEIEYISNKIIEREFSDDGVLLQERPYQNQKLNGTGFRYYADGTLMEKVELTDGEFDGLYSYFYPNGKPWVEIMYKGGKPWNALGNYLETGKKRPSGTLKDGNGTLIYYFETGEINDTHTYSKGIRVE